MMRSIGPALVRETSDGRLIEARAWWGSWTHVRLGWEIERHPREWTATVHLGPLSLSVAR